MVARGSAPRSVAALFAAAAAAGCLDSPHHTAPQARIEALEPVDPLRCGVTRVELDATGSEPGDTASAIAMMGWRVTGPDGFSSAIAPGGPDDPLMPDRFAEGGSQARPIFNLPLRSGTNALEVVIDAVTSQTQFFRAGLSLDPETYRLRFVASSPASGVVAIAVLKHESPYTIYGLDDVTKQLTPEPAYFDIEFTATIEAPVTDARLRFEPRTVGEYWIDRVRLDRSSDGAEIAAFDFESGEEGFGTAFDIGGMMVSAPVPPEWVDSGPYEVQLVVSDDQGNQSEPATLEISLCSD
jgi:hypothetical protein